MIMILDELGSYFRESCECQTSFRGVKTKTYSCSSHDAGVAAGPWRNNFYSELPKYRAMVHINGVSSSVGVVVALPQN